MTNIFNDAAGKKIIKGGDNDNQKSLGRDPSRDSKDIMSQSFKLNQKQE